MNDRSHRSAASKMQYIEADFGVDTAIASPLAASARDQAVAIGDSVRAGRYRIDRLIARGGMGEVYRAQDMLLDTPVALKFLPQSHLAVPDAVACFKREALIVMRLAHEHIVWLRNVEFDNNRFFLIMEFIDGSDTCALLRRHGSFDLSFVTEILKFCASALSYAHHLHIYHGDIKPANIMISRDSVLKLVDFGTAVWRHSGIADNEIYIEGTPCYMTPEQLRGDPFDARSDVYSLALCAYEFLEGVPAFPRHESMTPEARYIPDGHRIPDAPMRVLRKATAASPEHRWASVEEFYAAWLVAVTECGCAPDSGQRA